MENEENSEKEKKNNKHDVIESESNHDYEEKTTEDISEVKHQKIKLNEKKINSELSKEFQSRDDINHVNTNEIISKQSYYDKINRYLKFRRKKIILIILLSIGSIFLIISSIDMKNSNQIVYDNKNLLINNIFIFLPQIIYIFSLIIFQLLTVISKRKDNYKINFTCLIVICMMTIIRIFLYVKKENKKVNLLINLLISFFLFMINLVILFITLKIIKRKKNERQNIEEIINFTDIPQGTTRIKLSDKKDNQIAFNNSEIDNKIESNSSSNKDKISNLVKEENNKEDIIDDNDKSEHK
jgi:hypothetical protein